MENRRRPVTSDMKKSVKKGQNSIDIDLTSMLDVIFIILMVVMCNVTLGQTGAEEIREQLDSAQSELIEAQFNLETYENLVETESNVENEVAFISLHADYDPADPTTRNVRLLRRVDRDGNEREAEFTTITLTPANEGREAGFADVRDSLEAYLQANSGIPVLLRLDDERILYRDWVTLHEILDELRAGHANLFITEGAE